MEFFFKTDFLPYDPLVSMCQQGGRFLKLSVKKKHMWQHVLKSLSQNPLIGLDFFFLKKKLCFVVVVIGSGISGSKSQWLLIFWISLCENKKKVHLKAEEQSRNIRLVEIYVCWIICSHIVTDKVHEIRFLGLTWNQLLKTWPEPDRNPNSDPTRLKPDFCYPNPSLFA